MTTERENYLDSCAAAFKVFEQRHPDYKHCEAYARAMATELAASGLRPDNADHLAVVWERIKPKAAGPASAQQTAPAPESTDPVEVEARALIASGRISLEIINKMSSSLYELNSRSAVFCKALEILEPRREPSVLTHGELVAAAGQAALSTDQGIPTTTAEEVEKLESWKRAHFAKISTAATSTSGTPRGVVNLNQSMHVPKLATEADLAAQIKKQKQDDAFQEEVALKMNRARRVKAYKASRGR